MKQKTVKVYLLVGLAGSGKSTWARMRARKKRDTVIVCRDDLRSMLLGRYAVIPRFESLITGLTGVMVRTAVEQGFSVIVDETNLTAARRKDWIRKLKKIGLSAGRVIRVALVWFTETERNLSNRMKDPRGCPKKKWASVIASMKKRFEQPRLSEGCRVIKISFSQARNP